MRLSEYGLGIEALQRALPNVAKRTLQRHLARLASDGKLAPAGRARVYWLRSRSTEAPSAIADGHPVGSAYGWNSTTCRPRPASSRPGNSLHGFATMPRFPDVRTG
ncbi:hypothetical protein GCM10011394_10520 [Luteimonas terricola]|uniref:Uncharacterized protein n=1 Tax=Luteimonas terricola TaxID=645597 RepID=A0ABQ2EB44_9GAMM|nr:hypothetical protein GCM10011394_10520 [Luteimonas terricola]